MNATELSAYYKSGGSFCVPPGGPGANAAGADGWRPGLRADQREPKALKKELQRKEKALAEAAALLRRGGASARRRRGGAAPRRWR